MDLPTFSTIGPEIWGRSFWEFLDTIVVTFPRENPSPEHRQAVYEMMNSLQLLLPCPVCRNHYTLYLQQHPLQNALVSRQSFLNFYFHLKREIASRSNKPFVFKSPDELWIFMLRRLKLTNRINQPLSKPVSRPIFRVPRAKVDTTSSSVTKKGCGCSKRR